jgi:hypothetical protein
MIMCLNRRKTAPLLLSKRARFYGRKRIVTKTHRDSILLELNSSQQIILQWLLAEMNTKVGEKERVIGQ